MERDYSIPTVISDFIQVTPLWMIAIDNDTSPFEHVCCVRFGL